MDTGTLISTLALTTLAIVIFTLAFAMARVPEYTGNAELRSSSVQLLLARGRPIEVVAPDGTRLHAKVFGPEDAPTVVLAHGWTCSLRFWHHQIAALAGDHRVIAYDMRGHGRSEAPGNRNYSIEALAGDLDAVLEAALRPGERAVVAGHSLGAMTLIAWGRQHPDRVAQRLAGAALLNTGTADLIRESRIVSASNRLRALHGRAGNAVLASRASLRLVPRPVLRAGVRYAVVGPAASRDEVRFCAEMIRECNPVIRRGCGRTLARMSLADAAGSLDVPAVVVAGGRDRLTPPVHAERLMGALPQAIRLVEEPRSGHMTPVEAPETVTREVRLLTRGAGAPRRLSDRRWRSPAKLRP